MLFNAHTHINTSAVVSVINSYPYEPLPHINPNNLLSCGIHPWYVHKQDVNQSLFILESYCKLKLIQAIGECGLDANISDMDLQKEVFLKQIGLAEQYGLPVIIHSVKTHHLMLEIRKQTGFNQPWIIHGFQSKIETARQFQKQNIFISFGAQLLHQSEKYKQIINQVDMNFVLFETDDSEIDIKQIYTVAAEMLGSSLPDLERVIKTNFKRIFG